MFDIYFDIESNHLEIKHSTKSKEIEFINNYLYGDSSIKNVTALVGDNGVGKTTLLHTLGSIMSDKYYYLNNKSLLITKDSQGSLYIHSNIKITYSDLTVSVSSNILEIDNITFPDCKTFYLNNSFDIQDYKINSSNNFSVLSPANLLAQEIRLSKTNSQLSQQNILFEYEIEETFRQIQFILDNEDEKKLLPFELPDEVKISFVKSNLRLDDLKTKLKIDKSLKKSEILDKNDDLLNIIKKLEKLIYKNNNSKEHITFNLILQIIDGIIINYPVNEENKDLLTNLFLETLNDYLSAKKNNYEVDIHKFDTILQQHLKENQFFLHNDDLVFIHNCKLFYDYFIDKLLFEDSNIFNYYKVNIKENYITLFELCKLYQKIGLYYSFLNFEWGNYLSSGQKNLLNMYSLIYNEKNANFNHNLFLIDEADLSYHPKWQMIYMESLLNFIDKIFPEANNEIILATHSPIFLSDFPKHNVIFLENTEVGSKISNPIESAETFSQNIYTLFMDGFFVKKTEKDNRSLIVGSLANNHLNKLFLELEETDQAKYTFNEYEILINLIGEPVLQKIFKENLNTKFQDQIKVNKDVDALIQIYDELDSKNKDEFIKYIINSATKGQEHEEN